MKQRRNDSDKQPEIEQLIWHLSSRRDSGEHPFVIDVATHRQVHALAQAIRTELSQTETDQPVCLCTQNKAYVAASLLCALAGGPPLILPYAHSLQALEEARDAIEFSHALVDAKSPLPNGVTPVLVPGNSPVHGARNNPDPIKLDTPWVYLFTGGSSGTPQIWSKTPRNLLGEAFYLTQNFQICPEDRILSTVPPHHIYGLLYSILLPLISGASVNDSIPAFPMEIKNALESTRATVFVSIPPHYRALKESPISRHHLHTAFSSAGPLAEEDERAFSETTGIAVTEIYGSTETGGIASRRRAAGQPALTPFTCVDVEMDGELLNVRSDFLSIELERDDNGFYQTADRVAMDGANSYRIIGRLDGIVKVGGKRVDLNKVRDVLKQSSNVDDAYVFARPVQTGRGSEILALVEGTAEPGKLRRIAAEGLDTHSLPRRIVVVDRIPISTAGKYNRQAIEELF